MEDLHYEKVMRAFREYLREVEHAARYAEKFLAEIMAEAQPFRHVEPSYSGTMDGEVSVPPEVVRVLAAAVSQPGSVSNDADLNVTYDWLRNTFPGMLPKENEPRLGVTKFYRKYIVFDPAQNRIIARCTLTHCQWKSAEMSPEEAVDHAKSHAIWCHGCLRD